jgi:hypothetical protein
MNTSETLRFATARLREVLTKTNEDEQVAGIIAAQHEVLARYQAVFAPAHLSHVTEKEFTGFLLFRNNHHWTGLHRTGESLCADANMPRLREALTILLDESQPIGDRLDRLIPNSAPLFMEKFGRATITAILHVTHPDKYGVYNGTSEAGMKEVGVFPSFERGASFSHRYMEVNKTLHELASELGMDLWRLDALWWLMKRRGASKRAKQTARRPRFPVCIPMKQLKPVSKVDFGEAQESTLGSFCTKRKKPFSTVDVCRSVERYMKGEGKDMGRKPNERYASFDYCFNHFRSFYEANRIGDICCPENIHQSCLQIGFYLASWGMFRGNTTLLKKSARIFMPLVKRIVQLDGRLWEVDVDSYTGENIDLLLKARDAIHEALGTETDASVTLVTKIMLGIYGNVPAFDDNVKKGLGVNSFTRKNLKKVAAFYECHKEVIDSFQRDIRTFDFRTGEETNRHYTKAKIVDMAAFIEGQ